MTSTTVKIILSAHLYCMTIVMFSYIMAESGKFSLPAIFLVVFSNFMSSFFMWWTIFISAKPEYQ